MSAVEKWFQEFEALCSQVPTLFPSGVDDENVRIRALRLAEKAVYQLHTPMTFAEAQTWAPLELVGAGVACEMGIFDVLSKHAGSLSAVDIAKELDADPALVARIMRLLDAHYMVDQVSLGQYAANAIARDYVQPYRKGNVMTQIGLMPSYFALPAWLRANNYKVLPDANHCAWQVGANTTETFWESMSKDPSLSKYFNDYMTVPRTTQEEDFVNLYPFEAVFADSNVDDILFVDIGGGLGHQAMRVRSAFPRSRGRIILQDLPQVTSKITAGSLLDVEIMDHDMAHPQPVKNARVYYLRGVLHNHADHVSVQFLSRFAAAMGPESRLLIHEALATDLNPTKNITRFDLSMFASCGGAQRSEAEQKTLLEKVGLEVLGTRSMPRDWSIMEARLKRM
ncbi:S-adenosyl-L-methionine-dependent methyltransferase [Xylaria cubensis]|nr:S-adenosyl-L-methionine-dependent methyltransferase [Xylaria cubensis]